MDGVKPWQLAVIILGLVGGLGLLGWNLFAGHSIRTPNRIMLMDVVTGDRYVADVSGKNAIFIPERNPDTKQLTLLPIVKGDDGKWHVEQLPALQAFKPEQLKAFENKEKGIANPSNASPKPLRH